MNKKFLILFMGLLLSTNIGSVFASEQITDTQSLLARSSHNNRHSNNYSERRGNNDSFIDRVKDNFNWNNNNNNRYRNNNQRYNRNNDNDYRQSHHQRRHSR